MKTKPNLSINLKVGRVTPCAPQLAIRFPNGAHGVTRPTNPRSSWPRCPVAGRGFLLASAIFLAAASICFGQPVITNQPATQATTPGATVTFDIGAKGTAPLAYQWQKNPGNGFSDLADRTNAALVLTNVQPWDACDYRVVVTNLTGARTSAVARLYVMRPALVTTNVVLDNFDDNKLTGWTPGSSGDVKLTETNQQLKVWGYWPGRQTAVDEWCKGWIYRNWNLADGQTLEWRVDLVGMNEHTSAADIEPGYWGTISSYIFLKARDWISIVKLSDGLTVFSWDLVVVKNTNVVLALAMSRMRADLVLTARVLDKDNHNAVLYERRIVDTPEIDRSLTTAEVLALSGDPGPFGPDVKRAPLTSGDSLNLMGVQLTDGTRPAAEVIYDNLELWTSLVPVTRYVDVNSTNPTPPYTTWLAAATNIQDAVDVALAGDEIVVTNGIYATGGRAVGTNLLVNRVAVDKPLTVWSVNGPEFTIIQGYQVPGTTNGDGAIRCVYLTNGASLSGFTLTNGATRGEDGYWVDQDGGGLWCESTTAVVSNCVVTGNSARSAGGGASGGWLNHCTLSGNSADIGGATSGVTLNNCTVTGNSALLGGATFDSALNNCIVYFNTAAAGANYGLWSTLNYCCTAPLPADGVGNITNAPLFADYAGGNLRLQSNSPCINAGRNAYAPGPTDLDGLPRIVSGTVDIGAYEFQGPGSMISYAWLQHYVLPTDGTADATDADADGHTTWQEWRCLTDPTNALSVLRLLSATRAGTNVAVSWQSVPGVNYFLERSTNLWASPPFTLLAPNISGQPGTTSFTDTNAATFTPLFYRVGVGN